MKLEVGKVYEIDGIKYELNSDFELIELPKAIYDIKSIDEYYLITRRYSQKIKKDCTNEKYFVEGLKEDLERGNAFLTEKDAEFELGKRKTIAKIKKWKYENDDYRFIFDNENYYVEYVYFFGDTNIAIETVVQTLPSWLYFSSEEKAKECLEHIGVDNWKKYILEIEE